MTTENTEVAAVAPNALQDFTSCPHWGKGGQFIYDPVTKTRTPIDLPATESAVDAAAEIVDAPAAQAPQDDAQAATPSTTKKERPRA